MLRRSYEQACLFQSHKTGQNARTFGCCEMSIILRRSNLSNQILPQEERVNHDIAWKFSGPGNIQGLEISRGLRQLTPLDISRCWKFQGGVPWKFPGGQIFEFLTFSGFDLKVSNSLFETFLDRYLLCTCKSKWTGM